MQIVCAQHGIAHLRGDIHRLAILVVANCRHGGHRLAILLLVVERRRLHTNCKTSRPYALPKLQGTVRSMYCY
jgi:hypothetical protein